MIAHLLNKLRWSYDKNVPDLLALLKHDYPEFVFNSQHELLEGEIPVFVFHSVEPKSFEEKLVYLAKNSYNTLTGDEFRKAIAGEIKVPKRSVLLTFDDGTASLWTVAFPLLRKYGFCAVCFIIPGCIPELAPVSPTLEDFEQKRVSLKILLSREQSDYPLCSWQEIKEMHLSGVIDFQSHTLYHHRIFISPQLVDFFHPNFNCHFFSNVNVPVHEIKGRLNYERQMQLGTPIYRYEPRMAGNLQYFDDEKIRNACIEFVAMNGGKNFFLNKGWRKQLYTLYRKALKKHNNGHYESINEQRKNILKDLRQAKEIIENRLERKTVNQLCYPWYSGSRLAVELSKVAGYSVNYWGIIPRHKLNYFSYNLYFVPRIDANYIFLLPGGDRKHIIKILYNKFKSSLYNHIKNMKKE